MHPIGTGALAMAVFAMAGVAQPASAAMTIFQGNFPDFETAAGGTAIYADFEGLSGDIAGMTLNGITFASPDGNSLDVVDHSFSTPGFGGPANFLPPTSGTHVLSPGGPELVPGSDLRERDGLDLTFATPMRAFGLDVLFQSYDCCTFTSYSIYDQASNLLETGTLNGNGLGGGAPGSTLFFGVVSDDPNVSIGRIIFSEFDGDGANPDANIGYDTLRGAPAVPEPASWALMIGGLGLAGLALRRRTGSTSIARGAYLLGAGGWLLTPWPATGFHPCRK